jgi:hypothetical protein
MNIGKLDVSVDVNPKLEEHFLIKVRNVLDTENEKMLEYFNVDSEGELRLRLTLETALKLSQFIDEEIEKLREEKLGYGFVEIRGNRE